MKRVFWFRLSVLVLLAACQSPTATAIITPHPVATLRVTPTPAYIGPVKSLDGKTRAQLICYPGNMQWNCGAHFPNGNVLFGAPSGWSNAPYVGSPDNNYTIVCVGANHDSPCASYELWNMTDGAVIQTISWDAVFRWDPNRPHSFLYLVVSHYVGVLDKLSELDAATGVETPISICPEWFYQAFQHECMDFPGVIVGGAISGLPRNVQLQMRYYAQDQNMLWGLGMPQPADAGWMVTLRRSFGLNFAIVPIAEGYTSMPISYTVHISGTEAFIVDHGNITQVKAAHLDFSFVLSR